MLQRLLWVCLGGAAGSGARYLMSGWLLRWLGPGFPYGTLGVNLAGSFLLGLLMQLGVTSEVLSPTARLALTTGVMGGFTTYSTFSYETLRLLQEGSWLHGTLNIFATLAGCLAASFLGYALGRAWTS